MDDADEIALIVFYDCTQPIVEVGFTTDKSMILSKLNSIEPDSGTPLYYSIGFAKNYMLTHANGKGKKMIVLTDGVDTCEDWRWE